MKVLKYLLIICCAAAAGCSYESSTPDAQTGLFQTSEQVKASEVKVNKKVNLASYRRLIVLGLQNNVFSYENNATDFWQNSIDSWKFFEHVVLADQLADFLNSHGYGNYSSLQFVGIEDFQPVQQVYGNFLVAEITCIRNGGVYTLTFKVRDAKSGAIYFEVQRSANPIILGLDSTLFYPVLNRFHQWLMENK